MPDAATDGAQHFIRAFSNPEAIANYADGPRRFVPGFESLHRMTSILLGERAPDNARVLVLGAGGGLELKALALAHPGWTFVGVDPAKPMLDLAAQTLGPLMDRVQLIEGLIDDAPDGPFDAATCLLTLHFLDAAERLRTVAAIRRRLKPNAPFVAAHSSFPQDARQTWISRYAAYAVASGADPQQAAKAHDALTTHLAMFDPGKDEDILRDAGFTGTEMFFAAFTWRGWITYA
jgi:tRNA (cmo5U34)-methyltransferase